MIHLKELDGVVKPKHIARIKHALNTGIDPRIGIDAHIASSVVKGLLEHNRKSAFGNTRHKDMGYAKLYREKRKGQQFINGRQIKFYAVAGKRADKVCKRANRVFEALGVNAKADYQMPQDAHAYTYMVPSITIVKADPEQDSKQGITPSGLMDLLK